MYEFSIRHVLITYMNELKSQSKAKEAQKLLNNVRNRRGASSSRLQKRSRKTSGVSNTQKSQKNAQTDSTTDTKGRQYINKPLRSRNSASYKSGRQLVGYKRDRNLSSIRRGDRRRTTNGFRNVNSYLRQTIKNRTLAPSNVPINRNELIDTPLPWMETFTKSFNRDGEEGLLMEGTEYITELSVQSTGTGGSIATEQGDVIYVLPLAPRFFPGTRYKRMSTLFQKYRIKRVVFECVPTVPSTQNGALIGFITHDPVENFTIIMDPDVKLRNFMAHHGCHMWNVFNYGNMAYSNDNTIDWYFTGPSEEPRLEAQGQLFIAAASSYVPFDGSATSESINLCQVIMHYEVEFLVRKLEEDEQSAISIFVQVEAPTTWADMFVNGGNGEPILVTNSFLTSNLSVDYDTDMIIIMKVRESLNQDENGPLPVNVDTELGKTQLLSLGSVWYGFFSHLGDDPNPINLVICPTLSAALERQLDSSTLIGAVAGTAVLTLSIDFTIYNLQSI